VTGVQSLSAAGRKTEDPVSVSFKIHKDGNYDCDEPTRRQNVRGKGFFSTHGPKTNK